METKLHLCCQFCGLTRRVEYIIIILGAADRKSLLDNRRAGSFQFAFWSQLSYCDILARSRVYSFILGGNSPSCPECWFLALSSASRR